MEIELLPQLCGSKHNIWRSLLANAGLEADDAVEQTVLIWDGESLIATGSRQGNLLKCIAVAPFRQGEGLLSKVLTALRQEAFRAGHRHLFLYTKPKNAHLFSPLLFYPVAQTEYVLLMEDRKCGIQDFIGSLATPKQPGNNGAIVMNCDPFTLGHQHLISHAAASCDHVYVFVLSEDKGYCSAADRIEMVKQGVAHIPNVTVLPTGPYLISSATFPTYFLKQREQADCIQCMLDIQIFLQYFAPAFSITRRYVGSEPLCPITNRYNEILKENLPLSGIEVCQIPRLEQSGRPISASAVRAALNDKDWDAVRELVPDTTFHYLKQL